MESLKGHQNRPWCTGLFPQEQYSGHCLKITSFQPNPQGQNKQPMITAKTDKKISGNGEAKELICTTHGHELRRGNAGGRGGAGQRGIKGENGTTGIA